MRANEWNAYNAASVVLKETSEKKRSDVVAEANVFHVSTIYICMLKKTNKDKYFYKTIHRIRLRY